MSVEAALACPTKTCPGLLYRDPLAHQVVARCTKCFTRIEWAPAALAAWQATRAAHDTRRRLRAAAGLE